MIPGTNVVPGIFYTLLEFTLTFNQGRSIQLLPWLIYCITIELLLMSPGRFYGITYIFYNILYSICITCQLLSILYLEYEIYATKKPKGETQIVASLAKRKNHSRISYFKTCLPQENSGKSRSLNIAANKQ